MQVSHVFVPTICRSQVDAGRPDEGASFFLPLNTLYVPSYLSQVAEELQQPLHNSRVPCRILRPAPAVSRTPACVCAAGPKVRHKSLASRAAYGTFTGTAARDCKDSMPQCTLSRFAKGLRFVAPVLVSESGRVHLI